MYKTSLLDQEYKKKLITAEQAAAMVQNNSRIHFGLGLGTVKDIDKALAKRADELKGVEIVSPRNGIKRPGAFCIGALQCF